VNHWGTKDLLKTMGF